MPIFNDLKSVFVHIPKTGGTSISKALFDICKVDYKPGKEVCEENMFGWCEKSSLWLQHISFAEIQNRSKNIDDFYKFTFVRNPWDRAISDFFWFKNSVKISGTFEEYLLEINSFKNIFQNDKKTIWMGDHKLPQTYFFNEDELDFVGRFENIDKDFSYIVEKIGIKNVKLPHLQKTDHENYKNYYNNITKKLVYEIYYEDVVRFNYDF